LSTVWPCSINMKKQDTCFNAYLFYYQKHYDIPRPQSGKI
jgi:hypothetical protein